MVITDVRVVKSGAQCAVCCMQDGIRYHYWTEDSVNLIPVNDTLYKSPPLGTSRVAKDWFAPRKLKATKHQSLIEAMRQCVLARNLVAAAFEADAKQEAARLEKQRNHSRDHMVEELRSYARWDLKTPLDEVTDVELLAALERMIFNIRQKVS